MIRYRIFETPDTGFGLEAVEESQVIERSGRIFHSKENAEKFAELCNCMSLSPIHLADVAEDILKHNS